MLQRRVFLSLSSPSLLQAAKQRVGSVNLINGYVLKDLVHMMGLIISFPAQLRYRGSRAAECGSSLLMRCRGRWL